MKNPQSSQMTRISPKYSPWRDLRKDEMGDVGPFDIWRRMEQGIGGQIAAAFASTAVSCGFCIDTYVVSHIIPRCHPGSSSTRTS